MSFGLWFAALFALGAGGGIALFWLGAIATGRLDPLIKDRTDGIGHVVAELVTAGFLLAGGIATIADADAGSSKLLYGIGAGTLVYALSEAPWHYLRRGPKLIAVALLVTWPFLIAAIIARFVA